METNQKKRRKGVPEEAGVTISMKPSKAEILRKRVTRQRKMGVKGRKTTPVAKKPAYIIIFV